MSFNVVNLILNNPQHHYKWVVTIISQLFFLLDNVVNRIINNPKQHYLQMVTKFLTLLTYFFSVARSLSEWRPPVASPSPLTQSSRVQHVTASPVATTGKLWKYEWDVYMGYGYIYIHIYIYIYCKWTDISPMIVEFIDPQWWDPHSHLSLPCYSHEKQLFCII
jgi:hypothetical protein